LSGRCPDATWGGARAAGLGASLDRAVGEQRDLAVRARAYPQIVAEAPVVQIVRAAARSLVGRHLVTPIPAAGQQLAAATFQLEHELLGRQRRRLAMKRGVRLERELVPRKMRRLSLECGLQVRERAVDVVA